MLALLLRRLVQTVLVLLVMSFVIYGLIGLMPGDPIDLMVSADPNLTAADAIRLKALYGLDRPLPERYLGWLGRALTGDLGYSRLFAQPVLGVLGPRLANTLLLMGTSLLLAMGIALPLGIWAALRAGSVVDGAINLLAFAAFSVPAFWLGLVLILVFAVGLGWLPAGGVESVGDGGVLDRLRYMVLPVLTLTLLTAGTFVRFVRAALIDSLSQDFIRTARAKGCSPARTVLGHALRHAMLPVTTVLALHMGALFSGALVVEAVFAYGGMGKLIYDSIMGNDFNLALAALLLATFATLLFNLVADLAYARLDPRIGDAG
jgi:peptide/nickel transport system permease protein